MFKNPAQSGIEKKGTSKPYRCLYYMFCIFEDTVYVSPLPRITC
jgi:hypothetical protein